MYRLRINKTFGEDDVVYYGAETPLTTRNYDHQSKRRDAALIVCIYRISFLSNILL